jgi:hypothetical protein
LEERSKLIFCYEITGYTEQEISDILSKHFNCLIPLNTIKSTKNRLRKQSTKDSLHEQTQRNKEANILKRKAKETAKELED